MRIAFGIVVLVVIAALAWCVFPASTRVIEISQFNAPTEASVRAPIMPFRSGAMYVLYEGHIAANAVLTVVSNHGRDRKEIKLKAGSVQGVYGGPEEWVGDLSVVFTPSGTEREKDSTLKIGLYCGAFSEDAREWHARLKQR